MADESPGLGDRVSGAVERAKEAMGGRDDRHEADEAGGRVKVVRETLRRFGEGEHDQFFEAFHEEVEWVAPKGKKFPGAGTHSGREAVREKFVGEIEQGLPAFGFRPDHYLDADREEWVVTLGSFIGEGGARNFEVPGAVVWEFDGDKIARVRIYADSDAFPKPVEAEDQEGDEEDKREREPERAEAGENGKPESREGSEDDDRDRDDEGEQGAERERSSQT